MSRNPGFNKSMSFENVMMSTSCINIQRMNDLRRRSLRVANPRRCVAPNVGRSYSENNLNRTPEVFRRNFQGRPQQHAAAEFGIAEDEPFQHPRMFRNLNFSTDRAEFEALRNRGPCRPALPHRMPRFSDLPSERLEDFSNPSFNVTASSQISNLTNECLNDVSAPGMLSSVNQSSIRSPQPDECLADVTAPPLCDVSIPSPLPQRPPPCPRLPAMPTESLNDVSAPSLYQSTASSSRNRSLTNDRLDDISAPSFGGGNFLTSTPSRSGFRNECLHDVSAPTFYRSTASSRNQSSSFRSAANECLDNVSAPSLVDVSTPSFRSSRQRILPNECLNDVSAPSFADVSATSFRSPRQRTLPNECLNDVSAPSIYQSIRSPQADECLNEISAPSLCDVSMASPLPPRPPPCPRQLTDECLDNISAPSLSNLGDTQPSSRSAAQNNECLNDVTAPSFNTTADLSASNASFVDKTYNEILKRFRTLKASIFGGECPAVCPDSGGGAGPSYQTSSRANNASILDEAEMETDDVFGSSQILQPVGLRGAEQVTTTQFQGAGNDLIRETVVERSAINNGIVEKTIQRTITSRDKCGNVTTQMNETKSCTPGGGSGNNTTNLSGIQEPSFMDSGIGSGPPRPDPMTNISQLRSEVRRRLNFTLPDDNLADISAPDMDDVPSMTAEDLNQMSMPSFDNISSSPLRFTRHHIPDEFIDDVSAPSFGRSISMQETPPRRDRSLPRCSPGQQIMDISAPSFQNSMASSIPSERLQNISMPSFNDYASPARRGPYVSMAPEFLNNVCPPAMGRSPPRQALQRQRTFPSEFLDQESMPSFGSMPPTSPPRRPPQVSWTSECLDNMSAPGMDDVPSMTAEDLNQMSMPSFYNISSSPLRFTRHHIPDEFIDDVSAPSFGRSISMQETPPRRDRSLPRCSPGQQIMDISAPSFQNSMASSMPSERLQNISMPSFNDYASPARRGPYVSMAPEFLNNVCPPAMGRSPPRQALQRQRTFPSEFLDQESMPSFGSMPPTTPPRRPPQVSWTSECLDDMSAPGMDDVPSMTAEDLNQMSMPSFDNISSSPLRFTRHHIPDEFIDDVSAPSFGRSISMQETPPRRDRSLPRCSPGQQIMDISAPSFQNSMASSMPSERLQNISMPSFNDYASPARRGPYVSMAPEFLENVCPPAMGRSPPRQVSQRQRTLPNEFLDQVSMPSFGSVGPSYSRGRNRSFPCQQICDQSAPSFQSTDVSSFPSTRIDDMSMPSFDDTPYSPLRRRSCSLPRQQLFDESAPSFASSGASSRNLSYPSERLESMSLPSYNRTISMTDECLNDMSPPSFGRSMSPAPRRQSMPCQQILDTSAPSYYSAASYPSERLDEMSMPPFNHSYPATPPRRQRTLPSECLLDQSAPPSFADSSRGPATPSRLDDITEPSFNTTGGSSYLHLVNNRVDDISAPSMMDDSLMNTSTPQERSFRQLPQEQLNDVSAPFPDQTIHLTTSVNSVIRLDDVSLPPFESTGGDFSGRQRNLTLPDENLGDESAPSMLQTPLTSRSNRSPMGRRLEDISAPSFATTYASDQSSIGTPGRSRQLNRNQNDFGGFSSMANYAPFDEQIRSPNRSASRSPCARPNPCARPSPCARRNPCINDSSFLDDSYGPFSDRGPQFNSTFNGHTSRRNDKPCCRNRNRTR